MFRYIFLGFILFAKTVFWVCDHMNLSMTMYTKHMCIYVDTFYSPFVVILFYQYYCFRFVNIDIY
jgi:hypothetical protein